MTAIEWRVGDRGRVGAAEFQVTFAHSDGHDVNVHWGGWVNSVTTELLAAMGAVRIPPEVPPTIGTPQSVKDCPPPLGAYVLFWSDSGGWICGSAGFHGADWWMPQPAPPEVAS